MKPLFLSNIHQTCIFWKNFQKSSIKFHENPSSGSKVVPCGQTDVTKLVVNFLDAANAPKNGFPVSL